MRLLAVLFLLSCFASFAQPITIKIDALTANDSVPDSREFNLKYRVINNTSDTLKLFFNPNGFTPTTGSSSAKISYYKIYENDTFIDIGSIFTTNGAIISKFSIKDIDSIKTKEDLEKMYVNFLSEYYKTPLDSLQKIYKEEGFESLFNFEGKKYFDLEKKRKIDYQVLAPKEQLKCSMVFNWDKKRYFYRAPHEYYLDEKAKHYFEITLVALKEEYKNKIDEAVYKKVLTDSNFIKGVFVSNKVEINLKPN